MSDLAPAGTTQRARLTDRERREVVMVHVPLELFGRQTVQLLLVGHGTKGRYRQRLRLPPGEEARTMRPRQHADLDRDLANVLPAAALRPHSFLPHPLPPAL